MAIWSTQSIGSEFIKIFFRTSDGNLYNWVILISFIFSEWYSYQPRVCLHKSAETVRSQSPLGGDRVARVLRILSCPVIIGNPIQLPQWKKLIQCPRTFKESIRKVSTAIRYVYQCATCVHCDVLTFSWCTDFMFPVLHHVMIWFTRNR